MESTEFKANLENGRVKMAFKIMAKTIDNQTIEVVSTSFLFVCDRCGNTADFWNGMETFSPTDPNDKRVFCSFICAEISTGGIKVFS